jgi:hypothetical protein
MQADREHGGRHVPWSEGPPANAASTVVGPDGAGRLAGGEPDVARDSPLNEVVRHARWVVGSFKEEDIDKVLMRPNQGFEPLVSVVLLALSSPFLLGLVDLTR